MSEKMAYINKKVFCIVFFAFLVTTSPLFIIYVLEDVPLKSVINKVMFVLGFIGGSIVYRKSLKE